MEETKERLYWKGQLVKELTKEELIEALFQMHYLYETEQEAFLELVALH